MSAGNRNAATFGALAVLTAMGLALIGLIAMVMPAALGIFAVGFGFFLCVSLHYVLWGWWMPTGGDDDESPPTDA